jgi:hypothetical protein
VSATSASEGERIRLYHPTLHALERAFGFLAIGVGGVALAAALFSFAAGPRLESLLVVPFVFLAFWIGRTQLRVRPIFATPDGVIVRQRSEDRTIPWARIGPVQIPLSSSARLVARRYYFDVIGEQERIYFVASDGDVTRFTELWAAHGTKGERIESSPI